MLNDFGKIAVGELVVYPPILCISIFVASRHGFSIKKGWIFIFLFCSLRILGSILSINSQTQSNPSTGLLQAVSIIQALGLSPLLLATLEFVIAIADYGFPSFITKALHFQIRILLVIGFALAIVGSTKLSPTSSLSSQASGHTFLKAGVVCFAVAYTALSCIPLLLWRAPGRIPPNHLKTLRGLFLALPLLAVRVLYSALSAFVPSPSKWSSTTGNWKLYLVMDLMMEYIVVCTYVITAALLPLHTEEKGRYVASPTSLGHEDIEIGGKRNKAIC